MSRPRSERAHDAVLDAAFALFAERGIAATSMDAIADRSGVSKATIYKHWPDKDALCLEVLSRLHGRDVPPPDPDSGDLRADLVAVLSHRPPKGTAKARARIMPQLLAYAASNPAFTTAWRTRVLEPPRLQVARLLQRGIDRGSLPRNASIDLAIALLLGPMLYGSVLKLVTGRTPARMAERVVDVFLTACGATEQSRRG